MFQSAPCILARIEESELIIMTVVTGAVVLVFTIGCVRRILETNARERTKREVAAYVAEGSIQVDDAARLLATGTNEAEKKILDGVAWGTVNPEKAGQLIRTLRNDGPKAEPQPAKT